MSAPTPPTGIRAIVNLGKLLITDARSLVQQEIALARQELQAKIIHDIKIAALLIVSAVVIVLALFLLVFLEIMDVFTILTGHFWLGVLLTWLLYTVVFGVLAYIGFRRIQVPKPEHTLASLDDTRAWAQQQVKRVRP